MNTTSKQRIHLSIGFGDAILPVINCDDGHDRIPLRPIAMEIGISWPRQTRKLAAGKYLNRRLGIKSCCLKASGTAQISIRVDRVEAFLNTLNPENIRGMGNEDAASWLEAKHAEWDDALHAYETQGVATKTGHSAQISQVIKLARLKQTADAADRRWIDHLLQQQLKQLDVPSDLLADPQTSLPFASNQA